MLLTPEKPFLGIDARLINTSGIGTVCQNIIPFLIPDYRIVLLGLPEELKKYEWASECVIIPFRSKVYSLGEQLLLSLKVPVCDYFLSPHYNIPLLPIRAKNRIVIIHDVNHIALENNFSFLKKKYASLVINQALGKSDMVITVSEFSKSEIKKYFTFNQAKLHRIKLGVDKDFYKVYDTSLFPAVKQKYQLPEKFILYVGNVKPHKNLSLLIKAYHMLLSRGEIGDYKLVIVGKKEGFITNESEVFSLINTLNLAPHILFTGFVESPDLPIIYNLATLFVFPSIYEGFGLPPLEAMACGCPVVVSEAASLPEVCGDAALYFNPLDEEQLARTMAAVLQDKTLQDDLRTKGLALVKEYNWENTANEIKKIIRL